MILAELSIGAWIAITALIIVCGPIILWGLISCIVGIVALFILWLDSR